MLNVERELSSDLALSARKSRLTWIVTDRLAVSIVDDPDRCFGTEVIFIVKDVLLRDLVPSSPDEEWLGPPIAILAAHPNHLLGGPDRWENATDPWLNDPAMLACRPQPWPCT